MTRWRRVAVVLVAVSIVTAGIPMTGAFSSVSAERTVSVGVAEDDEAFLSLEPSNGANGAYAEQSGGTLELNFDGTGTPAAGLNPDATTYAADVFVVTNRGTNPSTVTVEDTVDGLSLYAEQDGNERRLDGDNAEGVDLGVGEEANVSVRIDSSNESALESLDEITIVANATDEVDGSPGDGFDGDDPDGGDGGSNGDSGDDADPGVEDDVARATGSASAGESVSIDLDEVSGATQDDITVESTQISYAEDVDKVNTSVSVTGPDGAGDAAPGDRERPPNASVRTYINVSHPETPDEAIDEASFRFLLPHDADTGDRTVSLLRYDEADDAWETASTRVSYVENSSEGYVYEGHTETLSLFAVVEAARGLYVQTNGTLRAVDASLTTDPRTDFPANAYGTYRDRSFNVSYWKADARDDADDAAAVIREELRVDLKQATKDAAIDQAVSYADDALQSAVGFSGIGTALTAIDIALKSDEFAGSLGPGIQKQAVAIHVDPGTESYDKLRANLAELEENSAAYKQANRTGNEAEKDRLLEEREALLRETYLLLPTYLNDVHGDVVGNAAGIEDPQAYQQIRSDVESLRLLIKLDYEETTEELYGAKDESLPRETSMPTHGWTSFGSAKMYDTMDHADDYAVFDIDTSPGGSDAGDLDIDVTGANATAFETAVVSERPDNPRIARGRELPDNGTNELAATIEDPADTTYLVVRAGGSLGPVKVTASGDEGPVDVAVAERSGPDVQRPEADLVSGPQPVTLADGDAVYPTNDTDTDLVWDLWDAKTDTADIEYRFRVDDGDGFAGGEGGNGWTAWATAPEDGRVSPNLTYGDGLTRVQLQVRDGADRTTVRNADVVVTDGPPITRVAAPLADDPASGDVYVKVLPERRVESVELEYRRVGDANWTDWRTVEDDELNGFGRLTAPVEGEIEVRVRATNLANETGAWASETLTYDPPDVTPPEIEGESIPSKRPTVVDGEVVERRVVADETVELSWSAEDDVTAASDLEHRFRVDDEEWSEWSATDGGFLDTDVDVATEGTNVTVEVRDEAGNVASRSVTVRRDDEPPTVDVQATDDVTGAVVDPSADEPLSSVELQYRSDDGEEWADWRTLGSTEVTAVELDKAGSFELRARGVDTAGNVGNWTAPVAFVSLPEDRSTPIVDGDGDTFSGGTNRSYEVPNASEVGSDAGEAIVAYNALVDQIDGELLLDLYVATRDGDRYPISSVTFTEDSNQTVTADLPGNLTDDARIEVEVKGNGTVVLASLRAIDRTPDAPPLSVEPTNATVGSGITVSAPDDWTAGDEIVDQEWDVDGDGEYERTTAAANVTTTYDEPGDRNVTLRLTDAFGASSTTETTVSVNAPPAASITVDDPALTEEAIDLDAGDSEDPDGEIRSYRWDLDGDGDSESTGPNASVDFADDGTYPVGLTVVDDQGATDTAQTNVTVENRPPTAVASVNKSTPTVGTPAAFDASDSADRDGDIESYAWDLDGDGEYERTGREIEAAFDESGERTVTLRVADDDGATNETTLTVDVNAPPIAAIDANSPVLTDERTTLSAADSDDSDGEIETYEWVVEGADDAAGVETNRSFGDDGTYAISLTVTDDQGATDTATENVTVENRRPTAIGAVMTDTPVTGEPVAFDASDSADPDGEVVETHWDLDGDGANESNASAPTATYDEYGERTATLTVVDDDGASNETTLRFDVNAPPRPALNASDPALTDEAINLDAGDSVDPDGTIETYEWDVDGDGDTEASGPTATVDFADDGTYPVELTVTDDDGTARSATRTVTVENRPPTAAASANDTNPLIGEPVALDAGDSADPDGDVDAAEWDVDDDGTYELTGAQTAASFDEAGERTVALRVTDDDDTTNRTTLTIDVNAPPEPEVNVSGPVLTAETATLNASPSRDPDGEIVAYEWTIEGATDAEGVAANRSFDDDGTYPVSLAVTDDDGATATATANVTVENRPPGLWLTRVSPEATPVETNELVEYAVDASDADGTTGNATITVTSPTGDARTVTPRGTADLGFNESGNWTVTAAVTDDDGAETTVNRTLPVNAPPDAAIDAPAEIDENEEFTVAADAVDPDGEVVEYEWEIDERRYTGRNVTAEHDGGADIPVTLWVTDDDGATAVANETIEVDEGLDAWVYVDELLGGHVLSASAYADAEDVDYDEITYEWDLDGDGQFEADGQFQDRVISEPGEYEFAVRVDAPNASADVDEETVAVESVDENVTFDWRRDAGGMVTGTTDASLYVAEGEEQESADAGGGSSVRSLASANGSARWTADVPFFVGETLVRDEAVYAVGGGVARIDRDSGDVEWSWTGDGYADVRIDDGTVYATGNRTVTALNAATGDVRWEDADRSRIFDLAIDEDTVVTWSQPDAGNESVTDIVTRDAVDGDVRWTLTRDGYPGLEGVTDGRVVLSRNENLTAYDADTGEVAWSRQLPDGGADFAFVDSVRIENGTVYASGDAESGGWVTALTADGERLWLTEGRESGQLAVVGEHVVLAGEGGVTAYDRTNGSIEWNRTLDAEYPSLWTDGDEALVEYDFGLRGAVFDSETGEIEWQAQTGRVLGESGYEDGTLYVGTGAGVYAVDDGDES